MPIKRDYESVTPASRAEWRKWLEKNHASNDVIWLVFAKKESGIPTLTVADAVEEALCFGWIDSVANPVDQNYFKVRMSPRNPKSKWSKINKDRVKKLIKQGLMTEAGLDVIAKAKKLGTWTALDKVEKLIYPDMLTRAFKKNKKAKENFEKFPPSARKAILQWLADAKTEPTLIKRIAETVSLAEKNMRANQWTKPKTKS